MQSSNFAKSQKFTFYISSPYRLSIFIIIL
nr:MAG TPA: hypothetical protein [Caudoviricetes sp.]